MAQLNQEQGGTHLGQGISKPEDESASNIHVVSGREGSNETSNNHEYAAYNDGRLSPVVISDVRTDVSQSAVAITPTHVDRVLRARLT
jgi:hypothetical protein